MFRKTAKNKASKLTNLSGKFSQLNESELTKVVGGDGGGSTDTSDATGGGKKGGKGGNGGGGGGTSNGSLSTY